MQRLRDLDLESLIRARIRLYQHLLLFLLLHLIHDLSFLGLCLLIKRKKLLVEEPAVVVEEAVRNPVLQRAHEGTLVVFVVAPQQVFWLELDRRH